MNTKKSRATALLILCSFAFALSLSLQAPVQADNPQPEQQGCLCNESGWCPTDSALTKYGWLEVGYGCRYTAPPPGVDCEPFVPMCRYVD